MADLADFTARVASRHPQDNPQAYDRTTHSYAPAFVHPQSYRLHLSACQGFFPLSTPPSIASFTWTVKQDGGPFTKTVTKKVILGRLFNRSCTADVDVPSVGNYTITLTVKLKDGSSRTKTEPLRVRDYLIVSLGDSMASGQGNPDAVGDTSIKGSLQCSATTISLIDAEKIGLLTIGMDKKPTWQEPLAYRSYLSGASKAAKKLQGGGRGITFLSFASSGAEIEKGLLRPQLDFQKVGQIAEAKKTIGSRRLNALLITIGVNDVGITGTLTNLLSGLLFGKSVETVRAEALAALKKLATNYDLLAKTIKQELNPTHVYITEYPIRLFDTTAGVPGAGCGVFETTGGGFLTITLKEAQAIHEIGNMLNQAIRDAAQRNGWILVTGIDAAFARHGYCVDDTFFRGAEESCRMQGDFKGMVHPNEKGHNVIAAQIVAALTQHTFSLKQIQKDDSHALPGDEKVAPVGEIRGSAGGVLL